jgi:predicted ABC-class ATPase
VTRVAVNDRQALPESARYGTEMARRPIAAPLERCSERGVDLATVRELAAKAEPYVRATARGSGA